MADGLQHVALALRAQLLALHVALHALQQVGEAAGQDAQLVAAAQVGHVELADRRAARVPLHVVRDRRGAAGEDGDAADQADLDHDPRECDGSQHRAHVPGHARGDHAEAARHALRIAGQAHLVGAERRRDRLARGDRARPRVTGSDRSGAGSAGELRCGIVV